MYLNYKINYEKQVAKVTKICKQKKNYTRKLSTILSYYKKLLSQAEATILSPNFMTLKSGLINFGIEATPTAILAQPNNFAINQVDIHGLRLFGQTGHSHNIACYCHNKFSTIVEH